MTEIKISDYITPKEFQKLYSNIFPTLKSLTYHLGHRETNGWMENQVVMEIWVSPTAKRPHRLLINPKAYEELTINQLRRNHA